MKHRIKRILACGLTVIIAVAGSVAVFAAEPEWGIMPDGYTFTTESTGTKVIVGGNSSSGATDEKTTAAEVEQIDLEAYADEIFRLANMERENAGLSPVERCEDMDAVAAIRAKELAESFSHTRPNGEWYTSLVDEAGIAYRYVGENAAKVPITSDAAKMMRGWMNSEGHRNNILNEKHQYLGVAVYQVGQMLYCSQMFYYQ